LFGKCRNGAIILDWLLIADLVHPFMRFFSRMTLRSFVLAPVLLALTAAAADRVALVIGNDAYQHARPLNAAVSDATAIAGALRRLNFDTITVANGGLEDMVEALGQLKQKAAGAKAVMVYYAGHGIESDGANYLIPVDAKLEREVQLETQALRLDSVLEKLTALKVPARMVVLDCCRDNPLEGRAWLATRGGGGGLSAIRQDEIAEATLIVYSASPGKPALDRVSSTDLHSPFTQALLDELPVPGYSFDVFARVEESVLERTDGRQSPRLFYNGSIVPFRNFKFTVAAPVQESPPVSTPVTVVPSTPPTFTPPLIPAPAATPTPAPTMVIRETPPPTAAAPVMPTLPVSGFFDLDALFTGSAYASYNSYSRAQILKLAQTKLKAAGHYSSSADGAPGPGTQRGILAWQQAYGLPLTGKLDAATIGSLGLAGQTQQMTHKSTQRQQGSSSGRPAPRQTTNPGPKSAQDILFGN
jgi:hypothetical protein